MPERRTSVSASEPFSSSMPAVARSADRSGERTRARTVWPGFASCRATWLPMNPDAPVTKNTTRRHSTTKAAVAFRVQQFLQLQRIGRGRAGACVVKHAPGLYPHLHDALGERPKL